MKQGVQDQNCQLQKAITQNACNSTIKNVCPSNTIWALPTWGLTCIDFELELFEIGNSDLGHPVRGKN